MDIEKKKKRGQERRRTELSLGNSRAQILRCAATVKRESAVKSTVLRSQRLLPS